MHNRLLQHIQFCYHEPLELLMMMGSVSNQEKIKQQAKSYIVELDRAFEEMIDFANVQLSPHMKRELDFFFEHEMFTPGLDFAFYQFAYKNPDFNTAPVFIQQLQQSDNDGANSSIAWMAHAAYQDQMDPFLDGASWFDMFEHRQRLIERVQQFPATNSSIYERLLECLHHPEETLQRFSTLLHHFYTTIYLPQKTIIQKNCNESLNHYRKKFEEDPVQVTTELLFQDPAVLHKKTLVHVSFVAQVMANSRLPEDPEVNWIVIGVNNEKYLSKKATQSNERQRVERLCKALGDERRFTILELLAERAWYGQELAEKLELTPAAINYHLNFFYPLQFIRTERKEQRTYLILDKEELARLLDLAKKVLTGG